MRPKITTISVVHDSTSGYDIQFIPACWIPVIGRKNIQEIQCPCTVVLLDGFESLLRITDTLASSDAAVNNIETAARRA
jgi:hypothetical protein